MARCDMGPKHSNCSIYSLAQSVSLQSSSDYDDVGGTGTTIAIIFIMIRVNWTNSSSVVVGFVVWNDEEGF